MKSHVASMDETSVGEPTSEDVKIAARMDSASSQAIFGNDRPNFVSVDGDKNMLKSLGGDRSDDGGTSLPHSVHYHWVRKLGDAVLDGIVWPLEFGVRFGLALAQFARRDCVLLCVLSRN